MANVQWEDEPAIVGDIVVGSLGAQFIEVVDRLADGRNDLRGGRAEQWIERHLADSQRKDPSRPPLVVFASWTPGVQQRAIDEAERQMQDLCNLAILLELDLEILSLPSSRGGTNRPGMRGLIPDRASLQRTLEGTPSGYLELACEPLCLGDFSTTPVFWLSAEPLPLDRLLSNDARRELVSSYLTSDKPIPSRLRVAARWYADSHWASDDDDAALALGVALDAIVGTKGASPSQLMAQRFAFLEPDPAARSDRSRRYLEIFGVRSSVAHGGRSSRLEEPGYIRGVSDDVRWAALRLVQFDQAFQPSGNKEFEDVFDRLRFGSLGWPIP
jgi:hypothetical protein